MKKLSLLAMVLAAAVVKTGFTPPALADQLHPAVTPTTCTTCDNGTASARWINNPSHFHLALDLKATGCTDFTGTGFAGGLITRSTQHPIETVSFDYKTTFCNPPAALVFFIEAKGTDGVFYALNCVDFPNTGTPGSLLHESFNPDSLSMPSGVKINNMWIGVVSGQNTQISGTVENLMVNGSQPIEVVKAAIHFCPAE